MWNKEEISLGLKAEEIIDKEFRGVIDKGGKPYIGHLYRVADKFIDNKRYVSALLHDLVEDRANWHEIKLREEFGDEIGDIVMLLTKKQNESYDTYLKRVSSNPDAIEVKLSDLRDNMDYARLNEITDKDIERLKKYHQAYKYLTSKSHI